MHLWHKTVPAGQADAWTERISVHLDPQRLVIVAPIGKPSARLEVYADTEPEACALRARFGGQVRAVTPESWQPPPVTAPGRPLSVGGRLLVTSRLEELTRLRVEQPGKLALCVPAAMAFGTGEHATTAMCLRLLLDVSRLRAPGAWDLLDLGAGSGILALAGRLFGARHAVGLDNDPHAVRTARENARLNGVGPRRVRFARAELPASDLPPGQRWPVVTANLFSELLIRLLPKTIAPAVAGGGDLILSGVLATQAEEVIAAALAQKLTLVATKSRGRWRAFHLRRNPL